MRADSALVRTISPSPNFNDRRGKSVDALVLHYTGMATGAAARARLLDPASDVSCHYLVWEDGRVEQMVAEADRAWHAGRSFWAGETDMNAVSIGIEIVNAGHDGRCPPYPDAQIAAVTALAADICGRQKIVKSRVLAHSDIAPDRKYDPGEWFPWHRLAAAGVGLWAETAAPRDKGAAPSGDEAARTSPPLSGRKILDLQHALAAFGYACPTTGALDAATSNAVTAFHRHYRPAATGFSADDVTLTLLQTLRAVDTPP